MAAYGRSICEGREFIDCPARYKCLNIVDVIMSSPAFANTFVGRSCLELLGMH